MPHEIVGQVVAEVVQGAGEVAVKEVHRKTGWKGCMAVTLFLAALGVGLYLLLR